jgi:hypothetical protein
LFEEILSAYTNVLAFRHEQHGINTPLGSKNPPGVPERNPIDLLVTDYLATKKSARYPIASAVN